VLECTAGHVVRPRSVAVGPALGIVELRSIARGYFVLDAMTKRAEIAVLHAEPVSPGKFWIAVTGGEAELLEAMDAGLDTAGDLRIDHVLLPGAHPTVLDAVAWGVSARIPGDAIGVIETATMAGCVRAADAALKCTDVTLVDLHLARGIGGKGFLVLTGALSDVEAALDAATASAGESVMVGRELMANPDTAVARATATRRR